LPGLRGRQPSEPRTDRRQLPRRRAPSTEANGRSPRLGGVLLAFDEQPALTGQDEERLLISLGVVNAALAGLEDGHIDPELRELDRRLGVVVGEPTRRAPRLRREPLGIGHVADKPTLRDGGKPGASVLKPRFVHAAHSRSPKRRLSRLRPTPMSRDNAYERQ